LFGSAIIGPDGQQLSVTCLKGKVLGIYFSAHWCPPCRAFTPQLAAKYRELVGAGKNFDIVFVSSDKSEQEMKDYFGTMPWKALPFSSSKKQELAAKYNATSLPTLVLLDTLGNTITLDGRNAIVSEPFPFGKVVSSRTFDAATVVLFYDSSQSSKAASACFDSIAQLAGAPTDGITFCKVNKFSNAVPQDLKSAPQDSWVCSQFVLFNVCSYSCFGLNLIPLLQLLSGPCIYIFLKSGKKLFDGNLQNVDDLKSFVTQHSGFIFSSSPVPSDSGAKVWKAPSILTEVFAHHLVNEEKKKPGHFAEMAGSCSGVLFIDEIHMLKPSTSECGKAIVESLMQITENPKMREQLSIIVAGYPKQVEESFLGFDPGLRERFPSANCLHFRDFNDDELAAIFVRYVNNTLCLKIDQTPLKILNGDGTYTDAQSIEFSVGRKLGRMRGPDPSTGEPSTKGFSNARRVETFADECATRVSMRTGLGPVGLLTRRDVFDKKIDITQCKAIAELRSMIGLDHVKERVDLLVATANSNMDLEAAGQPVQDIKLHKAFLGNPGIYFTFAFDSYSIIKDLLQFEKNII
jgi:thiol-disulfide isomerase/thioredoxin